MTGQVSGTQTTPTTASPQPEPMEQSSPSKGISTIDSKSQLSGSGGIDSTPIADRTVATTISRSMSTESTESTESGFSEEPPLLSERDYSFLKDVLKQSGEKDALTELEKYYEGYKNFTAIEEFLNDPKKTAAEKVTFLFNNTTAEKKEGGLASHMNRPDQPTAPETVIFVLEEVSRMLSQTAKMTEANIEKQINEAQQKGEMVDTDAIKQQAYEQLAGTLKEFLDTSSGPCFEARTGHMQEVFARRVINQLGVENDNILDPADILDPTHTPDKIIGDKCAKYMETCPEELEDDMIVKNKFIEWLKDENGLLGFKAAGTVITEEVIEECTQALVDMYVIIE